MTERVMIQIGNLYHLHSFSFLKKSLLVAYFKVSDYFIDDRQVEFKYMNYWRKNTKITYCNIVAQTAKILLFLLVLYSFFCKTFNEP